MTDLTLDVQRASRCQDLPSDEAISSWVSNALHGHRNEAELSVRIVDESESQELNHQYRDKDKPTNVLSFPTDFPAELDLPMLGDLVICAPVVQLEAEQQSKSLSAHWAHMVVHGTLHLLGYDHIEDADAQVMESLETRLLANLGIADPYAPLDEVG
ncbi:rRNA maturation RNase YbeY [Microbulbifer sp. A4B17]|uniref:rRNA maturation RNase YbeY n=1 Tax=Microbulbifer sp. A4B17 TaxID=359370 RepID=UPI000D52C618|nr:rRNA maturation RNase YbeY [Microbulbifer sp. A4B17]AWF82461.1 rRNA maturation RNase YbeY [Microbulbifer sp. A4B17]